MKPLVNHVILNALPHRCRTRAQSEDAKPASSSDSKNDKALKDAASQFEALLIGQLLKSVSSSGDGSGWGLEGEDDDANSTLTELSQEQFSRALASSGGLGLAQMAVKNLDKSVSVNPHSKAMESQPPIPAS